MLPAHVHYGWRLPLIEDRPQDAVMKHAPVRFEAVSDAPFSHLSENSVENCGFPGIDEAVFGCQFGNDLRQGWRIMDVQGNEPVLRYGPAGGSPARLIDQILLNAVQKESAEPALGRISSLDELAIEHDFMKEPLGQVLRLFIGVTFAADVAVDRLPVSLQQQADQGTVRVLLFLNALDQRPVRCQKRFGRPAHIRLVMKPHRLPLQATQYFGPVRLHDSTTYPAFR